MKVLICCYGSRGDVQPYIAIATTLKRQGHQVMLATSTRFAAHVARYDIAFGKLSDELLAIVDSPQGRAMLEGTRNIVDIIRINLKLAKQVKPLQQALNIQMWQLAKTYQPDIILFHPKAAAMPDIAEKLAIPCVLATPIPMFVPTADFSLPVMPALNWLPKRLQARYRRLSFALINRLTDTAWRGYVSHLRQQLRLPAQKRYRFLTRSNGRPLLILHLHSPSLLAKPRDWPSHVRVSGYCFSDADPQWQPSESLQAFLQAGPAPVYVGFGSMAGRNPQAAARKVIEALELASVRGILARGWGGLRAEDLPDSVYMVEQVPHDWLFPKVAAVVHHGGAGTTAAALRAGKPAVIVPFFGDQPFWAEQLEARGLAGTPIPYRQLNAERLAEQIRRVTGDPAYTQRCKQLAAELALENGPEQVVKFLEQQLVEDGA
ncbi:glycosyltransferase [Aliagarivorans marinus]|uniref:glycosyltransferase n=1 Tax=Aliagarivorans marinus TaxID=561965 RepID=UPI00041EB7CE|nr:glycosyltransferase [Aliagarivorans marinus]